MPALPDTTRDRHFPGSTREEVIAGFQAYVDLLRAHPEMPVTYPLKLTLWVHRTSWDAPDDRPEKLAAVLRALPGAYTRKPDASGTMTWEGWLHGLAVDVVVDRDAVCERVQVGEETVEHEATEEQVIPAREAWTETVPVYEWRCGPVLTAGETAAAAVETPAGQHATFDAEMRAAEAAGIPNLDNVTDPAVIGAYGLEPDYETCDECADQVPCLSARGLCDDCDDLAEAFDGGAA